MPQINIQLDKGTLKALERTAAKSHTTISKWIKNHIKLELEKEWPEDYFSLFGVLDEEDLFEPPEIPFEFETNRERL